MKRISAGYLCVAALLFASAEASAVEGGLKLELKAPESVPAGTHIGSIPLLQDGVTARIIHGKAARVIPAHDSGEAVLHFSGNANATDGEGAYLAVADAPELTGHQQGGAGWTSLEITARVRIEASKPAQILRKTNGSDEEGFMLYLSPAGNVAFQIESGDKSIRLTSQNTIKPDGSWHDITARWDGRISSGPNTSLTLDGNTVTGRAEIQHLSDTHGSLAIGAIERAADGTRPAGQYFAGMIKELRIGTLPEGALAKVINAAPAFVRLPPIFDDHMVLQRQKPVPVWGWSSPGAEVSVTIAGQTVTTTADGKGAWTATLAPMQAGGPHELVVTAGTRVAFKDVLIGEVWLCSGQSNMEWSLRNANSYDQELAALRDNPPPIRQIKFDRILRAWPDTSGRSTGGWVSNDRDQLAHFTAVGYHFARRIHEELDVPVGLINSTWGGSKISPWIPRETITNTPALQGYEDWLQGADNNNLLAKKYAVKEHEKWLRQAEQLLHDGGAPPPPPAWPAHAIHDNRQTPTGMYNGMIAPVAPFAIRGVLFYQGESNRNERGFYAVLMTALIEGWRHTWNDNQLPFYYVQLAPFTYRDNPGSLSWVQDAQRRVLAQVPHTGMAVTTDVGDPNDIHPRDKQPVGERLARWALSQVYGIDGVDPSGPLVRQCTHEEGIIRVSFDHAEGLTTRDGSPPSGFETASADGRFEKAEATIDGDTVLLRPSNEATTVRFAWGDLGSSNLVDASGLPTSPFIMEVQHTPAGR